MELISDGLLFLTALTTGFYCLVLARRLRRFGSAEDGIGPRIQSLSAAVEEMRGALGQTQARLEEMRRQSAASSERMTRETARAKRVAEELEAAASNAERTLDALFRADRRIARADSDPESAGGAASGEEERYEFTVTQPHAAGGPTDGASLGESAENDASADRTAPKEGLEVVPVTPARGGVLRVERVSI